jgi:hypothetical protein
VLNQDLERTTANLKNKQEENALSDSKYRALLNEYDKLKR